jgi:hypothetical protein
MLSINGIYDGKKIIPKEPIPVDKGKNFKVIITFIEPIEEEKIDLGKFCGIWEDNRDAKEIVEEIYKQRENFKLQEVK